MHISFTACFQGPPRLHAIPLASEQALPARGETVSVWVADATGRAWRHGHIAGAFAGAAPLTLVFPAFADSTPATYHLFVTEPVSEPADLPAILREKLPLAARPAAIVTPDCAIPLPPLPPNGVFLIDDGRIVPGNRVPAAITVTSDIGAYWCDQFGAYLSGWAHCTRVPIERLFLGMG